ncbi:hypothetical protein [Adonisia turfae]|nr:hypothetical protein [Adonisia turfae]
MVDDAGVVEVWQQAQAAEVDESPSQRVVLSSVCRCVSTHWQQFQIPT